MRLVLDTSVLIAGIPAHMPAAEVAVASISFAELTFGVAAATDVVVRASRQARLDRYRSRFGPGLPFDDQAAATFGQFCEVVIAGGRSPRSRMLDLMIAATAYTNDAGVVTRNPADFADLRQIVSIIEV